MQVLFQNSQIGIYSKNPAETMLPFLYTSLNMLRGKFDVILHAILFFQIWLKYHYLISKISQLIL